MVPKEHILSIRRKLTGENSSINSDGKMVVDNLIQKLTRAISELATNIYKKDSHFVMELIQNADDNNYKKGITPTLKIFQTDDKIIFKNNEVGFNADNIDSICDISKSTKGTKNGIKGYIGEKGIGFKSVFRVSDSPEIYSNGYQFKFNSHSAMSGKKAGVKLGFILPEWIEEPDIEVEEKFTNIVLPFKKSLKDNEKLRLADIEPDLILFLNKLQKLEIRNDQLKTETIVSRLKKDSIITILQESKIQGQKQETIRKSFHVIERDFKIPSSIDIPQRKGVSSSKIILAFPIDKKKCFQFTQVQRVYSFLPIIESGFRFLIQADFILTSGRESIDEDNPWNQFIRNEIAATFKIAIEEFKKHPQFKYTFINFIPYNDEIFSDFFEPLAHEIIKFCKSSKIILSESNRWFKPEDVIFANAAERKLFDNTLLSKATCKVYLSSHYPYDLKVFDTLGISSFSYKEIGNCLDTFSLISKKDTLWFFELFIYFSNFEYTKTLTDLVSKLRIIPIQKENLKFPQLVAPVKDHIFFPLEKNINYSFEKSINIFSKELYNKINGLKSKSDKLKIIAFLEDVGIRCATPYTITKNFILKKYETEDWKSYKEEELIDHLLYIKDHWSQLKYHYTDILALLKGKSIICCKNIGDGKSYFSSPDGVYISDCYGNKNLLEKLFEGIDKVWFINECYLKTSRQEGKKSKTSVQTTKEWYNFFKTLGCKELPVLLDSFSGYDVMKLIGAGNPDKINQLLLLFEQYWNYYKKAFNSQNAQKKDWYKKLTEERRIPIGKKLYYAKEIFLSTEKNKSFFGKSVTYFPRTIIHELAQHLGFNINVNGQSVIKHLNELSENKIKLTKDKAIQLYKYLLNDDLADLSEFNSKPLIFLPGTGIWYKKEDVFWADNQNIFGNRYGYGEKNFPLVLKDFFVDFIEIKERPGINHFIDFLLIIDTRIKSDRVTQSDKEIIYKIYAELGLLALKKDAEKILFTGLENLIWTSKGVFWKNENDIFYNDSDELFELYKDVEAVAFFDIQKNVLPKTKTLLSFLNIPSISEVIQTDLLNEDNATLDLKLTNKVRKYSDSIISIIYSDHTAFYEQNKGSALFENLKNIEIYESPELEVKYSLNEIEKLSQSDSFHFNNRIYVSRDSNDKLPAIALEISKLIGIPNLFEFILLLITLPRNSINSILKQKNIVPPPEESLIPINEFESNEFEESNDYPEIIDDEISDPEDVVDTEEDSIEETGSAATNMEVKSIISTEKWIPEIKTNEIDVNIESYSQQSDVTENDDKDGRVFSKGSFDTSNGNNFKSAFLSQAIKDKIGAYGEEKFFIELIRSLKEKYPHCKTEKDNRNQIFRLSDNGQMVVEVKWLNSKTTIQEGYDLVLTEDNCKKYFEVKTTRGTEAVIFSVSPQQWKFIKLKGENYSIIRVLNAGTKDIRLIEINNPYQLWINGKLNVYPINIQL